MDTHDETQTLEERTGCRLFSQRSIDAIAKHQDAGFAFDDDMALVVVSHICEIIYEHTDDPAVLACVLQSVANATLTKTPDVLAHLIGSLGQMLDCELLYREHQSRADTR